MDVAELYKTFGIAQPKPFSTTLSVHIAEAKGDLRLIIAHRLEKLGFTKINKTTDGFEAIRELKLKPCDIIVAGDDLPSVNGLEVLKELREDPKLSRGAFVLVTKPLNKGEVMLAVEGGVNDLLVRPVTLNDIMPKIQSAYTNFANPKNPDRLYEFAKANLVARNIDVAKSIYQGLSAINPEIARPYVGLARVALAADDLNAALQHANSAVSKNPNYVHAFALRAEVLVKAGKADKAVADFKKAVELSPLNITRIESCCENLLGAKLFAPCIEILTKVIAAGAKHRYVDEKLGYAYFVSNDFQSALPYLEAANKVDPENIPSQKILADCYRHAGNYDASLILYNKILKSEPENTLVLFHKALSLYNKDAKNDALKLLKKIVAQEPEFEKAKTALDKIEKELGLSDKAKQAPDNEEW